MVLATKHLRRVRPRRVADSGDASAQPRCSIRRSLLALGEFSAGNSAAELVLPVWSGCDLPTRTKLRCRIYKCGHCWPIFFWIFWQTGTQLRSIGSPLPVQGTGGGGGLRSIEANDARHARTPHLSPLPFSKGRGDRTRIGNQARDGSDDMKVGFLVSSVSRE